MARLKRRIIRNVPRMPAYYRPIPQPRARVIHSARRPPNHVGPWQPYYVMVNGKYVHPDSAAARQLRLDRQVLSRMNRGATVLVGKPRWPLIPKFKQVHYRVSDPAFVEKMGRRVRRYVDRKFPNKVLREIPPGIVYNAAGPHVYRRVMRHNRREANLANAIAYTSSVSSGRRALALKRYRGARANAGLPVPPPRRRRMLTFDEYVGRSPLVSFRYKAPVRRPNPNNVIVID